MVNLRRKKRTALHSSHTRLPKEVHRNYGNHSLVYLSSTLKPSLWIFYLSLQTRNITPVWLTKRKLFHIIHYVCMTSLFITLVAARLNLQQWSLPWARHRLWQPQSRADRCQPCSLCSGGRQGTESTSGSPRWSHSLRGWREHCNESPPVGQTGRLRLPMAKNNGWRCSINLLLFPKTWRQNQHINTHFWCSGHLSKFLLLDYSFLWNCE